MRPSNVVPTAQRLLADDAATSLRSSLTARESGIGCRLHDPSSALRNRVRSPWKSWNPPTAHAPASEVPTTPVRLLPCRLTFGLDSERQRCPFQCRISVCVDRPVRLKPPT